ncbi:MAG TPA: hypothetical protein VMT76_13275 [Puia sp.]|nr:hypothetical protein [Puia sp.]
MKKTNFLSLIIVLILAGSFPVSCAKSNGTSQKNNNPLSATITQTMIDSLNIAGAHINQGSTPPTVNGIFLMTPDSCVYDNSSGNFAGQLFDSYKFQFSNQDNAKWTVAVAQKDVSTGIANPAPVETYITGSGQNFTIYMYSTSTPTGVSVEKYNVLSGTLTANGIQSFQNVLYLRNKGSDPGNTVAPAGTIRVFVTGGSGLAGITSSF